MNQKDFEKVVRDCIDRTGELLVIKGSEYAGSEDRLANFKRGAVDTGATSLQVLYIYMSKHIDSFKSYIKNNAEGKEIVLSEPISGRLDDIINYCLLAQGLIKEIEDNKPVGQIAKINMNACMQVVTVEHGTVDLIGQEEIDYFHNYHRVPPCAIHRKQERERLDRV